MTYTRSPLMAERLADNRKRIMRATRSLIAEGGFREVSINAVAKEAGMSSGAIYRYFSSKSELYVQALIDAVDYEVEVLKRITETDRPPDERLRDAILSFVRRALKGPHLAYAFIAEPIDAEVDAGRIICRERFSNVFMKVLQDGVASGHFPIQDVHVSAACLVGAFTEALVHPITSSEKPSDDTPLIRAITEFCYRAVAGESSAPA